MSQFVSSNSVQEMLTSEVGRHVLFVCYLLVKNIRDGGSDFRQQVSLIINSSYLLVRGGGLTIKDYAWKVLLFLELLFCFLAPASE